MTEQHPFKWRHFQSEIILLCVRWYLRSSLSYRDLEEIMRERGLPIDHTTIYRWVQHYAPELQKRCRPHLKTTTDSQDGSMRRMSKSKSSGSIFIGPSIHRGTRSTSCSAQPEMLRQPSSSF